VEGTGLVVPHTRADHVAKLGEHRRGPAAIVAHPAGPLRLLLTIRRPPLMRTGGGSPRHHGDRSQDRQHDSRAGNPAGQSAGPAWDRDHMPPPGAGPNASALITVGIWPGLFDDAAPPDSGGG
jgi:hypothetical protein